MVRKQPPAPAEGVRLRTGDVVRVVVESERPGYVTVFNVGPTGDLNLLHPAELGGPAKASAIEAGRPVEAPQVEMLPPAGTERLFALWTAQAAAAARGGPAGGSVGEGTGAVVVVHGDAEHGADEEGGAGTAAGGVGDGGAGGGTWGLKRRERKQAAHSEKMGESGSSSYL